jgi:hypothetical protein
MPLSVKKKSGLTKIIERDVALALKAWQAGDLEGVAGIVQTQDDIEAFALASLTAASVLLAMRQSPEKVIDELLKHAGETPAPPLTPTGEARNFLRRRLRDGRWHSLVELRAVALAEGSWANGLDKESFRKTLRNAADHLGVESRNRNGRPWWRMKATAGR